MQCEYYALEGLTDLVNTIRKVHANFNTSIRIIGILRVMFDSRITLAQQVSAQLEEHFKDKVFKSIIPRNIRLAEAPSHGMPGVNFDPSSRGAMGYVEFAERTDRAHAAIPGGRRRRGDRRRRSQPGRRRRRRPSGHAAAHHRLRPGPTAGCRRPHRPAARDDSPSRRSARTVAAHGRDRSTADANVSAHLRSKPHGSRLRNADPHRAQPPGRQPDPGPISSTSDRRTLDRRSHRARVPRRCRRSPRRPPTENSSDDPQTQGRPRPWSERAAWRRRRIHPAGASAAGRAARPTRRSANCR